LLAQARIGAPSLRELALNSAEIGYRRQALPATPTSSGAFAGSR